jgi:carbamoyl-phosphate synthase large subunit
MEHIELAGIHSGDSACVIPPVTIPKKHIDTIHEYTRRSPANCMSSAS